MSSTAGGVPEGKDPDEGSDEELDEELGEEFAEESAMPSVAQTGGPAGEQLPQSVKRPRRKPGNLVNYTYEQGVTQENSTAQITQRISQAAAASIQAPTSSSSVSTTADAAGGNPARVVPQEFTEQELNEYLKTLASVAAFNRHRDDIAKGEGAFGRNYGAVAILYKKNGIIQAPCVIAEQSDGDIKQPWRHGERIAYERAMSDLKGADIEIMKKCVFSDRSPCGLSKKYNSSDSSKPNCCCSAYFSDNLGPNDIFCYSVNAENRKNTSVSRDIHKDYQKAERIRLRHISEQQHAVQQLTTGASAPVVLSQGQPKMVEQPKPLAAVMPAEGKGPQSSRNVSKVTRTDASSRNPGGNTTGGGRGASNRTQPAQQPRTQATSTARQSATPLASSSTTSRAPSNTRDPSTAPEFQARQDFNKNLDKSKPSSTSSTTVVSPSTASPSLSVSPQTRSQSSSSAPKANPTVVSPPTFAVVSPATPVVASSAGNRSNKSQSSSSAPKATPTVVSPPTLAVVSPATPTVASSAGNRRNKSQASSSPAQHLPLNTLPGYHNLTNAPHGRLLDQAVSPSSSAPSAPSPSSPPSSSPTPPPPPAQQLPVNPDSTSAEENTTNKGKGPPRNKTGRS